MTGIAVYVEGGGVSTEDKASLRLGMSDFLRASREAARRKRLRWKIILCGSRNSTHEAFLNAAITSPTMFNVLLVDSEGPVRSLHSPRAHLQQRDRWDLAGISERSIHLMIQTMETWIIADADSVASYYGQHFLKKALPSAQNLEGVEKRRIKNVLELATANTQKKEYDKISHASVLLRAIDPEIVRRRCPSCERLFAILNETIDAA